MIQIPLLAVPSQKFTVSLDGAPCQFWIRQLTTGLYLDLSLNNAPLLLGCLCVNETPLPIPLSPLSGKIFWSDETGTQNPDYTMLNKRFFLYYE